MQTRIDAFLRPRPLAGMPPRTAHATATATAPPPSSSTLNASTTPIEAFTDGACTNNGKHNAKAGVGVAFPDRPDLNVSEPLAGKATNNRAELTAILRALEIVDARLDPARQRPVRLYTDSMLCVNTFTNWVAGWKRNGWRKADGAPVLNADLVDKVDQRVQARRVRGRVEFVHVRAHTGRADRNSKFNELADQLASAGASSA